MEFIDCKEQYRRYKTEIDARIQAVLAHCQYIMGSEVAELEKALADYVGVKYCVTASSGTHTLEIAFRALGIGPGDEVITVPFTWISTAEAVSLVGARPVFVDIEPDTYNINIDLIRAAITPRTKCIMPVSLFGQMPDMDRINALADEFEIPVLEDAAHRLHHPPRTDLADVLVVGGAQVERFDSHPATGRAQPGQDLEQPVLRFGR